MATSSTKYKWLKDFNTKEEDPFKFMSDGRSVYCKVCEKVFAVIQRSQLVQHQKSALHARNMVLKERRSARQSQLVDAFAPKPKKSRTNIIGKELCEAMLSANIPWIKLQNPKLRGFLEKNIGISLPDESALRRVHLQDCYEDAMKEIRSSLEGFPIWIGVDETTDACGRYVANVIIGKLDKESYHSPFLVRCAFLENPDSSCISRLVNDTIRFLWPSFEASLLKLLLTDAAAYMLKSGKDLKVFYPALIHVTCIAHAFHRLCETIRVMFPEVNDLISYVKKVFVKAPSRVLIWKRTCDLPLPPEPILTRWGTWIEAALFYAEHLNAVRSVLSKMDPHESASIQKAQDVIENSQLPSDLAFIAGELGFLPVFLKKIETAGLGLAEVFSFLHMAEVKINSIEGNIGTKLREKFSSVLKRNPDIDVLRAANDALQGSDEKKSYFPSGMEPIDVANLKFAPVSNVDVERSFSVFKNVLGDRRLCLTEENINKIMVTHCFYHSLDSV